MNRGDECTVDDDDDDDNTDNVAPRVADHSALEAGKPEGAEKREDDETRAQETGRDYRGGISKPESLTSHVGHNPMASERVPLLKPSL